MLLMSNANNTASAGSTFNGVEEGRDFAASDEPTAAEWTAMQEEEALGAERIAA